MEHTTEKWKYNSLKEIADLFFSEDIDVISFDLFDTLVVRPVEHPSDVYDLLDKEFSEMSDAFISFKKLRIEAEAVLRRKIIRGELDTEDITLNQIYEVISGFLLERSIASDISRRMMEAEICLEKKLCETRQSGRWLWDRAVQSGKRVVVVSDMYLGEECLKQILDKNGYYGYEKIYVSSETGKRKITGNLYLHVMEDLKVSSGRILHIGDNEESDCRIATECGMKAALLPSAISVYDSIGASHQVEKICSDLTNWDAAKTSVAIGAMRQMAAVKYFDDPFRTFDKSSDYNNDPYFVGYGALGMHLMALTRWIAENAMRDKVDQMIFMARDGYLPKLAYDILRKIHPELPESRYLHVSRRAVLPAMISKPEDLYDLPVDITYQTPRKLMRLLEFCKKEDIESEEPFYSDSELDKDTYLEFIRQFIDRYYDQDKHEKAKQRIADYISSKVTLDNAALFDMGYSGRIPAALINATHIKPCIYYFHSDGRDHFRYEDKMGVRIRSFFDFNPYMEASIREYSYLEPVHSCIGYTEKLEEIYDAGPAPGYYEAASEMQKGAMDFINDFLKHFKDYENQTLFRYHDAAMPFEAFIRFCTGNDMKIYENVLIDDELWGGRRDIELKYLIEARRSKLPDYAKHEEDILEENADSDGGSIENVKSDDATLSEWEENINTTVLRESALNWYEFKKDSEVLLIDPDNEAIIQLLKRRCGNVDVQGVLEPIRKKYDYIINLGVKENSYDLTDFIAGLLKCLKAGGKVLLGAHNKYALRSFCGDRDGMDSRDDSLRKKGRYGRNELEEIINGAINKAVSEGIHESINESGKKQSNHLDSSFDHRFYYPVPDIRMPQMIYTDDYKNGTNARERLNDYNYHDGPMDIMEHRLFGDVIEGGGLGFLSDSFIIEIAKGKVDTDINYAVITTDRGREKGAVTTVRKNGSVIKRPLWPEGEGQLRRLAEYTEVLKSRDVPVVDSVVKEDEYGTYLEMPYMELEGLSVVLERMIISDRERFLDIFDAIYHYIQKGRGFLDLAPCNAFYIPDKEEVKDSILFYDQEFYSEKASSEYIMYRTIRYFFESSPVARNAMAAAVMYERYGITEAKQNEFSEMEKSFIDEVRNMDDNSWVIKASSPLKKPYHIGYVPGVFDLFHTGHLRLIERCKERCDILIVGVLTDELVEYYKGSKPVISLENRMEVIKGLRAVDQVIPVDFSNTDKIKAWEMLHYDCHFSGDDHVGHWNDVEQELNKRGASMEFLSYTKGISSTSIKKEIGRN